MGNFASLPLALDAEPAAGAASGARGSDERVRAEPEMPTLG